MCDKFTIDSVYKFVIVTLILLLCNVHKENCHNVEKV